MELPRSDVPILLDRSLKVHPKLMEQAERESMRDSKHTLILVLVTSIVGAAVIFTVTLKCFTKTNDKLLIELKKPKGWIRGHILKSSSENDYYAYQEIPFAAPPVGENRFKPPREHEGWTGILDATQNTKMCWQNFPYLDLNKTEDCLYINVYTPTAEKSGKKLPVLVYLYGGSLIQGTGALKMLSPKFLIDYGVIVVTFNYRLGPFGFLTTGDGVIPGNIGLRDQLSALKWVQNNIHLFSGDASKVTIWGQSAGARSVSYHLMSKKSKGLFRAAIFFSGTAVSRIAYTQYQKENALNLAKVLDPGFRSENSTDILELLMTFSGKELFEAGSKVKAIQENIGFFQNTPWNAVVENGSDPEAFLTTPFHQAHLNGDFHHVPLLYGFNSEEIVSFMHDMNNIKKMAAETDQDDRKLFSDALHIDPSKRLAAGKELKMIYTNTSFKNDLAAYVKFCSDSTLRIGTLRAAELTSEHVPVYMYQFSHSGYASEALHRNYPISGIEQVGHSEELFYIWKLLAYEIQTTRDLLTLRRFVKLITNFVKYLNPTPVKDELLGNIKWPPVKKETMQFLDINDNLEIRSSPSRYTSYRDTLLKYIQKPYDIFS